MCYLEDVFHGQCGHWSEEARVYHRCAAAGSQPYCFNKKTCGSLNEDSLCAKCKMHHTVSNNPQGMSFHSKLSPHVGESSKDSWLGRRDWQQDSVAVCDKLLTNVAGFRTTVFRTWTRWRPKAQVVETIGPLPHLQSISRS